MLTQFLNQTTVAVRRQAADKEQAIRIAGSLLAGQGLVAPAYIDEMIASVDRLGPYIVLSPGIAFAHARPSALVREDCASLVTLSTPVAFGHPKNDPVTVLFVLAARQAGQHLSVMREIAGLVARPGFVEEAARAQTVDDMLRYLAAAEHAM